MSGIQRKKKICKSCNTLQFIFSKGKCQNCCEKKPLNRTPLQKKPYIIPKQTNKNKVKRESQSAIRDQYFSFHINLCKFSEESGKPIYSPTRANICHIFDKSRHPSLQGNLNNFIYLTLEEHTEFDRLLYTHQFEKLELKFSKSWIIACQRMKNLLPLCLEETKFKSKIEEYLINLCGD